MAEAPQFTPDRLLVVANPRSSLADAVKCEIAALTVPTETVRMDRNPEVTRDRIMAAVKPGDLLLGACGDGGTNQIGNIIVNPALSDGTLQDIPFVPLRGGYANDIACMINGKKPLAAIVREGALHRLTPLEVTMRHDDDEKLWFALGYFSVGATAAASKALDAMPRGQRFELARKALLSWRVVARQAELSVETTSAFGGLPDRFRDLMLVRGDRIAKLGHTHAQLSGPVFEAIATNGADRTQTLHDMVRLHRGTLSGVMRSSLQLTITSETGDPIDVQFDGEHREVPSGVQVSAHISNDPARRYRTLATNLQR